MKSFKDLTPKSRLISLDAFRGITIAAMILVNNPGSWRYVYSPLRHTKWHGWTPTDLIFPFFLFIVGVSISFALSKRIDTTGIGGKVYRKIMRRTLVLFSLGLFLNMFPGFDLANIRIPGVLQRIALCYLFAALLFIKTEIKGRVFAVFVLLAVYWVVMKLVPVPGYGPGNLGFEGNLCGYIDTKLMAGHIYKTAFDPEGILSTLPAISTTLLGVLTGDWLRSYVRPIFKLAGFFFGGVFLIIAGLLLHPYFPINKQLWSPSFVLFTAGVALLFLGLCYLIVDIQGFKKWSFPFQVFGTNAITLYLGSGLMIGLISLIKISMNRSEVSLKAYIYTQLLSPWAGQLNGSLLYPLLLLLLWLGLLYPLYRKKIFIKI